MYNNLTKNDILNIIDKIQISPYYKNKLKKIKSEEKLRKEFAKLLDKYDKFINHKNYVCKLAKKCNKLKKRKIQYGGRKNIIEISDLLKNIILDLDNLMDTTSYVNKLDELETNIRDLSKHKLNKEYKKLYEDLLREQELQNRKIEEQIKNQPMSPQNIKLLKQQKEQLENQLESVMNSKDIEKKSYEDELNQKDEVINQYREKFLNLESINKELLQKQSELEIQKTELQNEYNQILSKLNEHQFTSNEEIERLKSQLILHQNKIQEINAEQMDINQCKSKLNAQQIKLDNLQSQVNNYEKMKQQIDQDKIRINQELENVNQKLKEQEEEINRLEIKNGELEGKRQEYEKKFRDIQIENEEKQEIISDTELDKKDTPGKNPFEDTENLDDLSSESLEEDPFLIETQLDEAKRKKDDLIIQKEDLENQLEVNDILEEQIIQEEEDDDKNKEIEEELSQEEINLNDLILQIPETDLEDESESLKSTNYGEYVKNKAENTNKKLKYLLDKNVDQEKVQKFGYEELKNLEELNENLDGVTSGIYENIALNWNKFLGLFKKNYELLPETKIVGDSNLPMYGGKRKKRKYKMYGGSIEDMKTKLNFERSEIKKNVDEYKFIKKIHLDLKEHLKKYNLILEIQPEKTLKRFSKGVIVLYMRLIENIMEQWEKQGWIKLTDDFFELDFNKLKNNDINERKRMEEKINKFSKVYQKPLFDMNNLKFNDKVLKELENFWNNYYILIRKWYLILKKYSKNLRGDQAIDIYNSPKHVQLFFQEFNILREKLDDYQILIRKPVSVYARINDIGRDNSGFENTKELCLNKEDFLCNKVKVDDYVMFNIFNNPEYENYLNLDISKCQSIQKLKETKPELFQHFERFSKLENSTKFDEIFFSAEFSNNNTISRYMLLDKLISKGIGVFLVTYGYSGTGKSFTLFGNENNNGLLQATIENIFNIKKTKFRIYEIYGLGLPYSDGYKDLKNINQELIHYNMKISETTKEIILDQKITEKYNDLENYIKSDKFIQLPNDKDLNKSLKSISKLVEKIDIERKNSIPARVKPTVNNPESSRSILIYDFIFTIKMDDGSEKDVSFVINDMPGLEDPVKTYIIENNKKIIFKPFEVNNDFNFYDCNNNNSVKQLNKISENKEILLNNVTTFFNKFYFEKELKYINNPIEYYQELLLMSVLINPIYIGLLKPNDIFLFFNEQDEDFKDKVLDNYRYGDNFEIRDNSFVFLNKNNFKNKILNDKNSVNITNFNNYDKDVSNAAIILFGDIIKECIKKKNFKPMINILSKILIESKIPSDPTFNQEIQLTDQEINDIKMRFYKKILSKYLIDFLLTSKSSFVRLGIDNNKKTLLKSYIMSAKRKQNLEKSIMINSEKAWTILKDFVDIKKVNNLDDIINIMLKSPINNNIKMKLEVKSEMRKFKSNTYNDFVEVLLKIDKTIRDSFEITQKIQLYEKKQNIIYQNSDKMNKIVSSFVNIAFEAWYINQNIAGILKYYSVLSDINPEIINTYVQKQDENKTSLDNNIKMVQSHLKNLYSIDGELMNMELNFYKIFCEIKNNTFSNKLFQTQQQEQNNELIVKDIINPYIEGDKPRIEDFKMFYVLSNNNTQLKCLNQAELFLNTRSFINSIGKK